MSTAYLTWQEARALAVTGIPIRRSSWNKWLTIGQVLWLIEDETSKRVVEAPDFLGVDFVAQDWTTDPIAAEDVCARPPAALPPFIPPTLQATCVAGDSVVHVYASLTLGSPGNYRLLAYLDGELLEIVEGDEGLSLSVSSSVAAPVAVTIRVVAESVLPLMAWREERVFDLAVPVILDMYALFPPVSGGGVGGIPASYGPAVEFGPFSIPVKIVSPSSDPASVDDDLVLNGAVVEPGVYEYDIGEPFPLGVNGAHVVGGGETFILLSNLPTGETFTLNVNDNWGGTTSADGALWILPV